MVEILGDQSSSPPSPTTRWSDAHEFRVQAPALRFAADARPAGGGQGLAGLAGERPFSLDLRAFAPTVVAVAAQWRHAIRQLDPESRVRVHEVVGLDGFDGSNLTATLRGDRWELLAGQTRSRRLTVDDQHRVIIPVGVRHRLGLVGRVVVSLAADRSRVVVWSSARLDELLEVDA